MEKLITFLVIIALIFVISLIMALPTLYLWNWLMPKIFGLVKIDFWQAFGLNLLTQIFFKSNTSKQ